MPTLKSIWPKKKINGIYEHFLKGKSFFLPHVLSPNFELLPICYFWLFNLSFQEKKQSFHSIRDQQPLEQPRSNEAVKKRVRFSQSSPQIFALFEQTSDNNNKGDDEKTTVCDDEIQETILQSESVISMARYVYLKMESHILEYGNF